MRYEDLVLDTRRTLQRVCDFLDELFEPQMLQWHETVAQKVPARELRIHNKLVRDPSSNDVRRWQREMSCREVLVLESFTCRQLKRIRYELRFASPMWLPVHCVIRLYCRTVLPLISLQARAIRYLCNRLGKRLASS